MTNLIPLGLTQVKTLFKLTCVKATSFEVFNISIRFVSFVDVDG